MQFSALNYLVMFLSKNYYDLKTFTMKISNVPGPIRKPIQKYNTFEECYTMWLRKEQRLFSDEQVTKLPSVPRSNPHYREWNSRKYSSKRLIRYLESQKRRLDILEIGCGNGWLSYQMATIPDAKVVGVDINSAELNQAKRVFTYRSNLEFIQGDVLSGILYDRKFDVIVFAASIEYFPSVCRITQFLFQYLLKPQGEVHILDTPLFTFRSLPTARLKTIARFARSGFPEMINYHFHHTLAEMFTLPCKIKYSPKSVLHWPLPYLPAYYWICLNRV